MVDIYLYLILLESSRLLHDLSIDQYSDSLKPDGVLKRIRWWCGAETICRSIEWNRS